MPQAIHEIYDFNSRSRKVAIHCVFAYGEHAPYQLALSEGIWMKKARLEW